MYIYINIIIHTHTHTHTHIYIYIYIKSMETLAVFPAVRKQLVGKRPRFP